MNDSPDSPDPVTSAGRSARESAAARDDREEPAELKVPRSIVRWSKWRKAALRAEYRESRRNPQGAAARAALSSGSLSAKELRDKGGARPDA